ncbi:unnamed protein product [Lepeophtheirus salmonis]|uniref:(salmon louse) hypothetical protein n=1 Tax=Lepeophtheirus salmonis TaxID=72036 RepID=A0A7R8CSB5_LEPSM|nr:unnamed protein product [Lepeophtheirus salmonis]CAF2914562.1 unnamed protein product [Lepeophtheirus salmonis]
MAVNGRDGCPKSSEGRCPFDEAAEEHEDDSGHFIINLSVLRSLNMIARRRHHMMIPRSQRAGYVQSLNRENPFRCSKLMSQLDDLYVLNLQMRFYWLRKHISPPRNPLPVLIAMCASISLRAASTFSGRPLHPWDQQQDLQPEARI